MIGNDDDLLEWDKGGAAKTLAKVYGTELAKRRNREKEIVPATAVAVQDKQNAFDDEYGQRLDGLARAGRPGTQRFRETIADMRRRDKDRERDRDIER